MDPLALLSDDDDDEEEAEASAGGAVAAGGAPEAKRPRTEDVFAVPEARHTAPQLDFEALKRAGYGDTYDYFFKDQQCAADSLRSSFAALDQAQTLARGPQAAVGSGASPAAASPSPEAEFGCEEPPDSIEVFDVQEQEQPAPWLSFDEAEAPGCLDGQIVGVMRSAGFEAPTPIQAHTWPILASGRDLIGVAKTGSGKTLAFLLPFFSKLLAERGDSGAAQRKYAGTKGSCDLPAQMLKQASSGAYSPDVLVLAPSRELAVQIESEAAKFTAAVGITTLACYGGEGLRRQQVGELRERPQCIVATIGRLADFLENEKHWFSVRGVRLLVLDEADHMIGEGLSPNIRKITVDVETPNRQTALFSATFMDDLVTLATWITRHAVEVRVGMRDPLRANKDVDQRIMIVKDDADKEGALKSILRRQYGNSAASPGKTLVFAFDPEECESLQKKLRSALNHANVETLHGNRKQSEREKAMADFRSGVAPIMVATDIAGRGLDVKDIKMVIIYDPPEDGQTYVHRIGRTGRAGNKGVAYTLLRKGPDGRAMIYIAQVMRRTGIRVPDDLIAALKQRRGRDMGLAAETLQGLCNMEQIDRSWAKAT